MPGPSNSRQPAPPEGPPPPEDDRGETENERFGVVPERIQSLSQRAKDMLLRVAKSFYNNSNLSCFPQKPFEFCVGAPTELRKFSFCLFGDHVQKYPNTRISEGVLQPDHYFTPGSFNVCKVLHAPAHFGQESKIIL